ALALLITVPGAGASARTIAVPSARDTAAKSETCSHRAIMEPSIGARPSRAPDELEHRVELSTALRASPVLSTLLHRKCFGPNYRRSAAAHCFGISSTRRFCARPASVSLLAIGFPSPRPSTVKRSGSPPRLPR